MGDEHTEIVKTHMCWLQAQAVVHRFLDGVYVLPSEVTDKQLTDLMTACRNARQRLAEKNDGG